MATINLVDEVEGIFKPANGVGPTHRKVEGPTRKKNDGEIRVEVDN